jgi:hypothetical protein
VEEELKKLQWGERQLSLRKKGDVRGLKIARLRQETTMIGDRQHF